MTLTYTPGSVLRAGRTHHLHTRQCAQGRMCPSPTYQGRMCPSPTHQGRICHHLHTRQCAQGRMCPSPTHQGRMCPSPTHRPMCPGQDVPLTYTPGNVPRAGCAPYPHTRAGCAPHLHTRAGCAPHLHTASNVPRAGCVPHLHTRAGCVPHLHTVQCAQGRMCPSPTHRPMCPGQDVPFTYTPSNVPRTGYARSRMIRKRAHRSAGGGPFCTKFARVVAPANK